MTVPVILPKQGNSVESCLIARWMKQVGDPVCEGEPVCEVETDKATVEVLAPAAGVLLAVFRAAGDDVPVMTAIAAVGAAGEDFASLAPNAAAGGPEARTPAGHQGSSEAGGREAGAASPRPADRQTMSGASPRARAVAERHGVDVEVLPGSGPEGLIIERDVRAAPRLTPAVLRPASDGTADIPVKGIRTIIAERMRSSLATTAQLTLFATAKAVALQAWRSRAKAAAGPSGQPAPTINDLMLFAVSRVLPRFPEANAHFLGDRIRRFTAIHLGLAVDTEKGLLVPVLRDAEAKTLAAIAAEAKALAKAAQAGKATPEQLEGSTFSVTNLGNLGIDHFTPVLNAPEVAILGVGGIALKPYQGAAGVEFHPSIHLSLTIDHQALDGAPAARFLQALVQTIEHLDAALTS